MKKSLFQATINGKSVHREISPQLRLVDFLRDELGLTGTKEGCGEGECGACTVIVDGDIVNACLLFALQVQGKEIITIEGVGHEDTMHPIQEAFVEKGAIQCGYCTPGMVLAAKALLDRKPSPDRKDIALALSGNVCRCTGYTKIADAVEEAARVMGQKEQPIKR